MYSLRILSIALFWLLLPPSIVAQGQEPRRPAEQVPEPPRQNIASTNADPAWRPSPEQRASIEVTTKAYFSARDSSKFDEAYAFLSARQKQYRPQGVFQRLIEEFNAKAGPVQARRLRAGTWYKDTPQAGPGLYVAVDYSSDFPNLALHCGYLVWQEQPDGRFLQVREEENVIDNATMAKLKPIDLEKVRAQFRC
jgi:hypothetical protein